MLFHFLIFLISSKTSIVTGRTPAPGTQSLAAPTYHIIVLIIEYITHTCYCKFNNYYYYYNKAGCQQLSDHLPRACIHPKSSSASFFRSASSWPEVHGGGLRNVHYDRRRSHAKAAAAEAFGIVDFDNIILCSVQASVLGGSVLLAAPHGRFIRLIR